MDAINSFGVTVNLEQVLRAQLNDPDTSFSIGAFGAVAEFFHDADEASNIDDPERLTLATDRGAIRICMRDDVFPVAYEILSSRKQCWLHGIVLCLPTSEAKGAVRTSVSELGAEASQTNERTTTNTRACYVICEGNPATESTAFRSSAISSSILSRT